MKTQANRGETMKDTLKSEQWAFDCLWKQKQLTQNRQVGFYQTKTTVCNGKSYWRDDLANHWK